MHISTMDRLQYWVQKEVRGKLIDENCRKMCAGVYYNVCVCIIIFMCEHVIIHVCVVHMSVSKQC